MDVIDSSAVPGTWTFEALYRSHHVPMVRLGFLLTGSQEVAEELAHEAFLLVHGRMGTVREPPAYLRQVVVNLTRQHHRRAEVERRRAPAPPGPVLPSEIDETWDLLWRLPERQRIAVVLRFYGDLTVPQVAEAMECRLGTAKSLIHRALGSLKESLT